MRVRTPVKQNKEAKKENGPLIGGFIPNGALEKWVSSQVMNPYTCFSLPPHFVPYLFEPTHGQTVLLF